MQTLTRLKHGTFKPLPGALIDMTHPFMQNLLLCSPFYEGRWNNSANANGGHQQLILFGSVPFRTVTQTGTAATWTSNVEGSALSCASGASARIEYGADFIPSTAVTICIVRRKRDTTARNSALFGIGGGVVANRCGSSFPFSDGVAYWDFGGVTSGTNRLAVSGLTFTTNVEHLVFTAGPRGMSMWRNGVKLGSLTTPAARTPNTALIWGLNNGNGAAAADANDFNYFHANSVQWDDALIQQWMVTPYAHFYPSFWPEFGSQAAAVTVPRLRPMISTQNSRAWVGPTV